MDRMPKITLEVEGLNEISALLETAVKQTNELRDTIDQINVARLTLQAKINQPTAATDG